MEKTLEKLREKILEHETEILSSQIQYDIFVEGKIDEKNIKDSRQLFESLKIIFSGDETIYKKNMVKNFNIIEELLKKYEMSAKERFKIWFYLINYNIIRDILSNKKTVVDYEKLKSIDIPKSVADKINELTLIDKIDDLLKKCQKL